jgi:hypothetical protein
MKYTPGSAVSKVINERKVYNGRNVNNKNNITNTYTPVPAFSNNPNATLLGDGSTLTNPFGYDGLYQFPIDSIQDYSILFRFAEYQRPFIDQTPTLEYYSLQVLLPMPNNLLDMQHANWYEVSGFEGAIGDYAAKLTNGAFTQAAQQLGDIANPFLTMLFKGVSFRSHIFQWKLAPTSQQESDNLFAISRIFRKAQLPDVSGDSAASSFILKYPTIIWPEFMSASYLYQFNPCIIEDIVINYAPSNTPSFFGASKAPVEATLTLQLKEIVYDTKRTYDTR